MTPLILHIGAAKTGTTAIQAFLSFNRAALERCGVWYPAPRQFARNGDDMGHNALAYQLCGQRETVDLKRFRGALVRRGQDFATVVLSAEVFYMRPAEHDYPTFEAYWAAKTTAVARTREFLEGFDVEIVCYVRRQDLWLEAIYNERVKTWKGGGEEFHEFISGIREEHFIQQLDLWGDHLGKDRITVRPYEPSQLAGGDVIADFCEVIGAGAPDTLAAPPKTRLTMNPRLHRDVLEFQRVLSRLDLALHERRPIQRALYEISDQMLNGNGEPGDSRRFLSADQRRDIVLRFEDANRRVGRAYLKRAGDRLFVDDVVEDADDGPTYPGLSVDRATEIVGRLEQALSRPSYRWERYVLGMRGWVHGNARFLRPLLSPFGRLYQRCFRRRSRGF